MSKELDDIQGKAADYIDDMNSLGEIEYARYSELRDCVYDWIEEAYSAGHSDCADEVEEAMNAWSR